MAETPLTRNTSTSDLQGRLTAAQAIFDTNKRDDALRAVADAAGEAGEPGVVKAAVGAIFDTNKKDAAADSAAVALAREGKRIEATAVARMIFDTVKKDATLSKLAKN